MAINEKTNDVNLKLILQRLEEFCQDCDQKNNNDCQESKCLVGFGKKVLRFSLSKGILDIPGAYSLIPKKDLKPYYMDALAGALAETCNQCRDCRENHSSDCVISLVRTSLENAILQEEIDYPGSVFLYLAQIKNQNPALAHALANALSSK